jgi:hypothetical protein
MSAAWHGGLRGAKQWAGSPVLARGISSAMDYWFSRDFTVAACLDQGGTDACPCDTPGFWNTNWFSNVGCSHTSERPLIANYCNRSSLFPDSSAGAACYSSPRSARHKLTAVFPFLSERMTHSIRRKASLLAPTPWMWRRSESIFPY